jgi:hypothetical protein
VSHVRLHQPSFFFKKSHVQYTTNDKRYSYLPFEMNFTYKKWYIHSDQVYPFWLHEELRHVNFKIYGFLIHFPYPTRTT